MERTLNAAALLDVLHDDPQHQRLLRLNFPMDDGPSTTILLANCLDADEGLSRDFRYVVEVISDQADLPLGSVLDKMVTISLVLDDGTLRYFNGYAHAFRFLRTDGGFAFYELTLLPWLAYLRHRQDSAVFQALTLTELCQQTFGRYLQRDYRFQLTNAERDMTLALQFRESDYNHVHRRLEAAGIHYWYEHRFDGHTLCLSDDSTLAEPLRGGGRVAYQQGAGAREDDGIAQWRASRKVGPGAASVSSHDFKRNATIWAGRPSLATSPPPAHLEVSDYLGDYGVRDDDDGEAAAARRMQELDSRVAPVDAEGNVRMIEPRHWFMLTGHFAAAPLLPPDTPGGATSSGCYLVVQVRHQASNNYQDGRSAPSSYTNRMRCVALEKPWRPGRNFNSIDTRIYGPQTATVVGPVGEEIYTDKFGRARLQFHWDRQGHLDERSLCWVRVMSSWAGDRFGYISLPRVGQEVVVTFMDGNCDRPMVIGSVYNARNMPPWELPGNRTQSGILTRSSKGGSTEQANALRFEDRKGAEEIWMHAERDQRLEVEHDETHWVGNDRSKTVDRDERVSVRRDRTETVGNNEDITVGRDRTLRVGRNERVTIGVSRSKTVTANEKVDIGRSWSTSVGRFKTESVAMGYMQNVGMGRLENVGLAYALNVGGAMVTTVGAGLHTNAGQGITLNAGTEISLTVGKASLLMRADGTVLINGQTFRFQADGAVQITGADVDIN